MVARCPSTLNYGAHKSWACSRCQGITPQQGLQHMQCQALTWLCPAGSTTGAGGNQEKQAKAAKSG